MKRIGAALILLAMAIPTEASAQPASGFAPCVATDGVALARCLAQAGYEMAALTMLQAALESGTEVVRRDAMDLVAGLGARSWDSARVFGQWYTTTQIEGYARGAGVEEGATLWWLRGEWQADQGFNDEAHNDFDQIGVGSRRWFAARQFRAVGLVRHAELQRAIGVLRDAVAHGSLTPEQADLTWVQLARGYYSAQDWRGALDAAARVRSRGGFVRATTLVSAWALFRLGETSRVLTVTDPATGDVLPRELQFVRALALHALCRDDEARAVIAATVARASALVATLRAWTQSRADEEPLVRDARRVLSRQSEGDTPLGEVMREAMGDSMLARRLAALDAIDAELTRLGAEPSKARETPVGSDVLQMLTLARSVEFAAAADLVRARLARANDEITALAVQAQLLDAQILDDGRP